MSDLIDRQAAIDAIKGEIEINGYSHVVDVLKQLPSAQPEPLQITIDYAPTADELERIKQAMRNTPVMLLPSAQPERKTGKWVERNPQNSDKCRLIECDQCGFSHIVGFNVPYEHWIENRNFCERCGADMRGEGE